MRLCIPFLLVALKLCPAFAEDRPPNLKLVNNQHFPIHMPVELRQFAMPKGNWSTSEGKPVQKDGSNLILIASLEGSSEKEITFRKAEMHPGSALKISRTEDGLALSYDGKDLGKAGWQIFLKHTNKKAADSEEVGSSKTDFDSQFKPLALKFEKTVSGPLFEIWKATGVEEGLKLEIDARAFYEGFLDLRCRLVNESCERTNNIYAAVVSRWEQPRFQQRSLCYDNRISKLAERGSSGFRQGEGRHLFVQRGVDWIRTSLKSGANVAWLNDFAPSFTVQSAGTIKTPARWEGANLPQLGQEVEAAAEKLYSITEIARGNIRSFRDRLKENVLPPQGESVSFESRIVFGDQKLDDKKADEMFVGWTSYNEQRAGDTRELDFGVRSVRFGTSYFPYSTLGENFDQFKLPGMDRESFWPLAADTVNQWKLLADDIRRDLRIAKAMGFQLIRLHHLELLAPIEKKVREEYLDFIFGELRHLKLKALVDVYASPEQIKELLRRYGDVVDSVEIENEILIWGIPVDRPKQWNEIYEAVKSVAPRVQVHLTGYNNTGMFDRLSALGVKFDRVGLHSYVDSLEAILSARGYALALSSYASKAGKPPVITEWNWRGLTKMTESERAKIYPQIIEGAIGTRGIPDFYQFQFQETLCPNPRVGRGNILRHYELLHLSRRPKAEAVALMGLIRKYSAPEDPMRLLDADDPIVYLDAKGHGWTDLRILNRSKKPLDLRATIEAATGLEAKMEGDGRVKLAPAPAVLKSEPIEAGRTAGPFEKILQIELTATNTEPGFYHCLVRLESEQGLLRYGVIQVQKWGEPKFTGEAPKVDWTKPVSVVYGKDAPVLEVETAIAIAETLESAMGREVEALEADKLRPYELTQNSFVVVGTQKSNEWIGKSKGFEITGKDSSEVEKTGMDFILSYWRNAKDSAARKVGLVEKELPKGGDAAKLP